MFQVRKENGSDKDTLYAMKVVRKSAVTNKEEDLEHLKTERRLLESLDSGFIVKMYYAFHTEEKLYFVMEYVKGGELFTLLEKKGTFKEDFAKFYIAEITLALEYLHSKNVLYRDLKPDNILIDTSGHLKLVDMGMCKTDLVGDDLTQTFCGTVEYMAPEIVRKRGHGKEADLWSLGIMMFDMLHGEVPFRGESRSETLRKIVCEKLRMPEGLSPEAQDLLRRLMTRNVRKRITCQEIKTHPFFSTFDWDKASARELTPPFVPKFENDEDVSYFSTEFTGESVKDKIIHSDFEDAHDEFSGFTYVSPILQE